MNETRPEHEPSLYPSPGGQPPPEGQGGYPPYPSGAHPGFSQAPYGHPPAKKRLVWPWVLGAVILVAAVSLVLVVVVVNRIGDSNREITVVYEVVGPGDSIAITYSGRDFNTVQQPAASLPWIKEVTLEGPGETISLTATNGSDDDGAVTCKISARGITLAFETSNGPTATATCVVKAEEA